jgi:hypothetical protein
MKQAPNPGLPGDPPIAIDAIDKGDVLMVTRLDRLARSIQFQRPERDSPR